MCGTVCRRNLFPIGPSSDGGKPCEPRLGPPYGRGATHTSARLGTVVSTACMVALSRSKPWYTGKEKGTVPFSFRKSQKELQ